MVDPQLWVHEWVGKWIGPFHSLTREFARSPTPHGATASLAISTGRFVLPFYFYILFLFYLFSYLASVILLSP